MRDRTSRRPPRGRPRAVPVTRNEPAPVPFGHRLQNTASTAPRSARRGHAAANTPPADSLTEPSKSAARLTAEAAFSGSGRVVTQSAQAPVVIRRRRLVRPAGTCPWTAESVDPRPKVSTGKTVPSFDPIASNPVLDRGPRVFRIIAKPLGLEALTPPGAQAERPPATIATDAAGPLSLTRTRSRRISADKRPGPVLHQIHRGAALNAPTVPETSPSTALSRQLAAVEPVLVSIAHAQSLVFINERWAAEWQRLSRQVEALRQELNRLQR